MLICPQVRVKSGWDQGLFYCAGEELKDSFCLNSVREAELVSFMFWDPWKLSAAEIKTASSFTLRQHKITQTAIECPDFQCSISALTLLGWHRENLYTSVNQSPSSVWAQGWPKPPCPLVPDHTKCSYTEKWNLWAAETHPII